LQSKPLLGFHVSISGSLDLAVDRAIELGCTTFQVFTRNPRGWKFSPLDETQAALFARKREKAGFEKIVAHMPYLPNLATSIAEYQRKSRDSLTAEMSRCGMLGVDYLVAHIGYHEGKGSAVGVRNVIESCNQALEKSEGKTMLLIETAAGQRGAVGSRFEELRAILDGVKQRKRMGVCVDTCHIFAAGFDIANEEGVKRTMEMFDDIVGYDRLKVVHLNDSKGPMGSNLDRHQFIGEGYIGKKGFQAFLRYRENAQLPMLMEIPVEDRKKDDSNMKLVRKLIAG
jgi:deoxyribonuclease-4